MFLAREGNNREEKRESERHGERMTLFVRQHRHVHGQGLAGVGFWSSVSIFEGTGRERRMRVFDSGGSWLR